MYQTDHHIDDKLHVNYVMAIDNSTDGLSAEIKEHRQIYKIIHELEDIVLEGSGNDTLIAEIEVELHQTENQLHEVPEQEETLTRRV